MSDTVRMAADAGFGEAEFEPLMQRLGVDPGAAADPRLGFVVAAARSACRACEAKGQCRLALGLLKLALLDVAPFCPNAERISYLQCSGLKRKA